MNKVLLLSVGLSFMLLAGCSTTPSYTQHYHYEPLQKSVTLKHIHYGNVLSQYTLLNTNFKLNNNKTTGYTLDGIESPCIYKYKHSPRSSNHQYYKQPCYFKTHLKNISKNNSKSFPQKLSETHTAPKTVINILLKGGEVISIAQDGAPKFYKGQAVKIIGTGNNVQIVVDDKHHHKFY